MFDDFIILPLGSCERRRSLKSLKSVRNVVGCRISHGDGLEGLITLTWDEVEITLDVEGVERTRLGLRMEAVEVGGEMSWRARGRGSTRSRGRRGRNDGVARRGRWCRGCVVVVGREVVGVEDAMASTCSRSTPM